MSTVNRRFVKELQELGLTVCFGESITCGLAAHNLSTVKGTMDVLVGGLVCYHPSCKMSALKIPASLIKKYTAESQQVTDAIVKSLPRLFDADIYASITGLAAAGGTETKDKPVGTVFISVLYLDKIHPLRKLFRGSPTEIKEKACREMYLFILKIIKNMK